jgi:hypothetical protein
MRFVRMALLLLAMTCAALAQTGGWTVTVPGPTCSHTFTVDQGATQQPGNPGLVGCTAYATRSNVCSQYNLQNLAIGTAYVSVCAAGSAILEVEGNSTSVGITGYGDVVPQAPGDFPVIKSNTYNCDSTSDVEGTATTTSC